MITEVFASDADGMAEVRQLFTEYADSLGPGSLCFQDFDRELAALPGAYVPPAGGLWLARVDGKAAGCIALRSLADGVGGELKRLYLRPGFRGRRVGRTLAETAIDRARSVGHRRLRLDTMPFMGEAISLYRSLGFRPIDPYCYNPVPGAVFMELELEAVSPGEPAPAG
jgi:GNAT superfamily N-acetyltransferase